VYLATWHYREPDAKIFIMKLSILRIIRGIFAVPLLLIVPIIWLIMLCIFIIPLLLIYLIRKQCGCLSYNSTYGHIDIDEHRKPTQCNTDSIIFNRVNDVSKLIGCYTRNVLYKWDIFTEALQSMKDTSISALDFGAGSLRDTYELSILGFNVDALDINIEQMRASYNAYNWSIIKYKPRLLSNYSELQSKYQLIIAFDVIEHLVELESVIQRLRSMLTEDGLLFVSVPNCKSLIEKYFKFWHKIQLKEGKIDRSGTPHVNYFTPEEWKLFFSKSGFDIKAHDMTIGYFVNNVWFGLYAIPSRFCMIPFLNTAASLLRCPCNTKNLERLFYPRWLMTLVNEMDEATKTILKEKWGWNLFILSLRN